MAGHSNGRSVVSRHLVIGSGPAGVACAQALVKRGLQVQMLDAGLKLEPARAEFVAGLRATAPADWSAAAVARLKEGVTATSKGIPLKRVYGSDFPYAGAEEHLPADYQGVGLRPSLALGGLSNVWGSAMLPYREDDMQGWEVTSSELAAHYRAVLEFTGLSATKDDLETLFPLHAERAVPLRLSRQAKSFLATLTEHRDRLRAQGMTFGGSRIAVQAGASAGAAGCVYCGLCMYGCPYGYIYNSADTVHRLAREKNFTYSPGVVVTHVREDSHTVHVSGYARDSRQPVQRQADRVYLAAGVLPTTAILLRSLEAYAQPVTALDSQYFLFPLLRFRGQRDVRAEALNTLSQLFLEIQNRDVNRHTVHLQVYSYNDLVGQAVRKAFGPLAKPLELLARRLEERLLVVQAYLHSDDSAKIRMMLRQGGSGQADRLEVTAQDNPATGPAIRRVIQWVRRNSLRLGGVPVSPMLQVAEPGRGFHSGGSFPMRRSPGAFETDLLGRPRGWDRIHAVDSTVLPSIPATTITFSVMANAHRIGWEAGALP